MGIIERLDPLVQSQIAAGEVVLGPSSVVKELVENSLDAGAGRITIDFTEGGLPFIRVSDDGCGMVPEDATMALERFATSKLRGPGDLYIIDTLGFRGEALPSIASVAKVTLETRAKGAPSGVRVRSLPGHALAIEEAGLPEGTTVTVEDLFHNTPARLKFLKSKGSERQAVVDIVTRLALAAPDVVFILSSGDNVILRTSGLGLKNALSDIFGPSDASKMVEIPDEGPVCGFVGLPSLYRRTRDRQMFSVNSRPVRNPNLGWAVDAAFAGLLPPKTFAAAVLDIRVPRDEVDVNVHPTKAEVKFKNERDLRGMIGAAVGKALFKAGFTLAAPNEPSPSGTGYETRNQDRPGNGQSRLGSYHDTSGKVNWYLVRDLPSEQERELNTRDGSSYSLLQHSNNEYEEPSLSFTPEAQWEYLGSLADTYLVAKTPATLLIIDKHALMESITYASLVTGKSGSQELLVSEVVRLDPKEAVVYESAEDTLHEVGFASRLVGDRTVMVTAVPLAFGRAIPPSSIRDVLSRIAGENPGDPVRTLAVARLETAACHASIRAREHLSADEARALIDDLYKNPAARTCPHGRPTVREMTIKEIGEFFGRS